MQTRVTHNFSYLLVYEMVKNKVGFKCNDRTFQSNICTSLYNMYIKHQILNLLHTSYGNKNNVFIAIKI